MAATDFQGLARWDRLQASPFGTTTALRPTAVQGPVGQQYRRMQEDYNSAMRMLRRDARRGDTGAALQRIKLREQANAAGFAPGGIRSRESFDQDIMGRARALEQGAMDMDAAAANSRGIATGLTTPAPAPETETPDLGSTLDDMESDIESTRQRFAQSGPLGGNPEERSTYEKGKLKYRQTLDQALGKAETPEQVEELKKRGARYGNVSPEAFDRRVQWWQENRTR